MSLHLALLCLHAWLCNRTSARLSFDLDRLSEEQRRVVQAAQAGDPRSFNTLGMALLKPDSAIGTDVDLAVEFLERAAQGGYVPAYANLGRIYAEGIGVSRSTLTAFHWYSEGARQGHQGSVYNCGLLLAEGVRREEVAGAVEGRYLEPDPLAALQYFQHAYLMADATNYSSTAVTEAAATAHRVLSDTVAFFPLELEDLRRVWHAGSLNPPTEYAISLFERAWECLQRFKDCFSASNGEISGCKDDMRLAVRHLGELVETHSAELSHLQLFLALDRLQDMIGPLAGETDSLAASAGRYAEALALSHYCRGRFAVKESDAACFNGAVSSAMSYYRRAGLTADADRVFALANAHPEAAVRWRRKSQTPRVFHPELLAQPWWNPELFSISHELRAAYERDGGKELQRQLDDMIMLKDGAVRGSLNASASDGLQRIYTPYIGVWSADSAAERGAGTWAEFGPLFDGVAWNEAKCATVPLICDTLKNHSAGELCGGYSALSSARELTMAEDIELECGADTVVTILRLRPGAHILPHCGTTNKRLIMHFALRGKSSLSV